MMVGGKNSSTLVVITLVDLNDNAPSFQQSSSYVVNISEAATLNSVNLLSPHATDGDISPGYNEITYSIPNSQPCSPFFSIDQHLGTVKVTSPIDYETGPIHCDLIIQAADPLNSTGVTTVTIDILDSNEFRPVILSASSTVDISVHEALVVNDLAYQFEASDRDGGPVFGAVVDFELIPVSSAVPFSVSSSGTLTVTQALNRSETYSFELYATDGGGLESDRVLVRATVTRANYFAPEIVTTPREVTVRVDENSVLSRPVWTLQGQDLDEDELEFLVIVGSEHLLRIQPNISHHNRVNIWLNQSLDFESSESHVFEIAAFDGFYTSSPVVLRLQVLPVNEYHPTFPESYVEVEIMENLPPYSYGIEITVEDFDR